MIQDIPGLRGYKASTDGKIIGKNGRELKPRLSNGYYSVGPVIEGKQKSCWVHRLIAATFLPNPGNLPYVNHINGDKTDNRVENLEWCTPSRNAQHSWDNGLRQREWKNGKGRKRALPTGTTGKIDLSAARIANGMTQQELADKVGVIRQTISHIENGRITPSVPTAQAIAQVLGIDWTGFYSA